MTWHSADSGGGDGRHGTQMMPTLLDLAAAWTAGPSTEMGENREEKFGVWAGLGTGGQKKTRSVLNVAPDESTGGHRTKAPLLTPRLSWGSRHGLRT